MDAVPIVEIVNREFVPLISKIDGFFGHRHFEKKAA